MKAAQVLLTLAIVTTLPGCGYLVVGCHNVACWTSRHWSAEKAWRERKWMYADIPCRGSFKGGFKAGYRFACGGYDSCEPPQLRHYWRFGGLTESERQNAQAWSDGFTHGTVAAQQDQAVGPSALDTAAMQPPEGVPDVRYYNPPQMPGEMDQMGGSPYYPNGPWPQGDQGSMPGGQFAPSMGENYQYAPNGGTIEYGPPPSPAPASEGAPAPGSSAPRQFAPPPAPAGVPAADGRSLPSPVLASEGFPGIGSLRTTAGLQPAPPAEPDPLPQQQAASPPLQATQAADWELPLIRN